RAHAFPILAIDVDEQGRRIASGDAAGPTDEFSLIKIRNQDTGRVEHTLRGHQGWIRTLRFLPGGDRLLSIGNDGIARLWDTRKGVLQATLADNLADLAAAAISGEGNRWAWCNRIGVLEVHDVASRDVLWTRDVPGENVTALAFD